MAHEPQAWDGPNVHGRRLSRLTADERTVEILLTEKAARRIALALRRMQQTTMVLPREGVELADALDFLMVGDPTSQAKQRELSAWKRAQITEPAQDGPMLDDGAATQTWSAYDTNPRLRALRAPNQPSNVEADDSVQAWYDSPQYARAREIDSLPPADHQDG
jgi:hypothetical protein